MVEKVLAIVASGVSGRTSVAVRFFGYLARVGRALEGAKGRDGGCAGIEVDDGQLHGWYCQYLVRPMAGANGDLKWSSG